MEKVYFNKYTHDETIKQIEIAITEKKNYEINVDQIKGDILKIEFYDEESKIDQIVKHMDAHGLQMARMKPIHVEVTHEGVSKGKGLT